MATKDPTARGGALFDADGVGEIFRVSVVVPEPGAPALTAEEIARRLGGDPASLRVWDRAEGALAARRYLISQDGPAWVVAESDTFCQATPPALLRSLSRGATVHTLASDFIVAMTEFFYARDGEIVTVLDPYFPDERRGSDPDALGPHLDEFFRLAEAGAEGDPAAAALLTARCPAALSMAWWNGEHQVLFAPEPPDDPPDPDSLWALLESADPAARRRALFDALDEVLGSTGLAGEDWVTQALADARTLYGRADRHPSVIYGLGVGEPRKLRKVRQAAVERVEPHVFALSDAFEPPNQPRPVGRLGYRTRPRRPGAPSMPDDPLWHREQAGRALHQLILFAGTEPAHIVEIDVLGHLEAAAHRAWPQVLARIRATVASEG